MGEGRGEIHYDNPFATPPGLKEPVRRLRGSLASGVTVWTSGPPDERAGLTMSSVLVTEGRPSLVLGLMSETSELFDAIGETGAFVVHVLQNDHRRLADRFAGLWPSPEGLFADLEVDDSAWGPAVKAFGNRAFCRLKESIPAGFQRLVIGEIERIELDAVETPLVHFRGRYRMLAPINE